MLSERQQATASSRLKYISLHSNRHCTGRSTLTFSSQDPNQQPRLLLLTVFLQPFKRCGAQLTFGTLRSQRWIKSNPVASSKIHLSEQASVTHQARLTKHVAHVVHHYIQNKLCWHLSLANTLWHGTEGSCWEKKQTNTITSLKLTGLCVYVCISWHFSFCDKHLLVNVNWSQQFKTRAIQLACYNNTLWYKYIFWHFSSTLTKGVHACN